MNFKAYDIISKLLPGLALIYSLIFLYGDFENYSNADYILPITVIAFFVGYIIDAISSWLEDFYYLTWKGKPSTRLLAKNKGVWKVTAPPYLNEVKMKVRELIEEDISDDEVFRFIQNSAFKSDKERLSDFLQSYVSSLELRIPKSLPSSRISVQPYLYFSKSGTSIALLESLRRMLRRDQNIPTKKVG